MEEEADERDWFKIARVKDFTTEVIWEEKRTKRRQGGNGRVLAQEER